MFPLFFLKFWKKRASVNPAFVQGEKYIPEEGYIPDSVVTWDDLRFLKKRRKNNLKDFLPDMLWELESSFQKDPLFSNDRIRHGVVLPEQFKNDLLKYIRYLRTKGIKECQKRFGKKKFTYATLYENHTLHRTIHANTLMRADYYLQMKRKVSELFLHLLDFFHVLGKVLPLEEKGVKKKKRNGQSGTGNIDTTVKKLNQVFNFLPVWKDILSFFYSPQYIEKVILKLPFQKQIALLRAHLSFKLIPESLYYYHCCAKSHMEFLKSFNKPSNSPERLLSIGDRQEFLKDSLSWFDTDALVGVVSCSDIFYLGWGPHNAYISDTRYGLEEYRKRFEKRYFPHKEVTSKGILVKEPFVAFEEKKNRKIQLQDFFEKTDQEFRICDGTPLNKLPHDAVYEDYLCTTCRVSSAFAMTANLMAAKECERRLSSLFVNLKKMHISFLTFLQKTEENINSSLRVASSKEEEEELLKQLNVLKRGEEIFTSKLRNMASYVSFYLENFSIYNSPLRSYYEFAIPFVKDMVEGKMDEGLWEKFVDFYKHHFFLLTCPQYMSEMLHYYKIFAVGLRMAVVDDFDNLHITNRKLASLLAEQLKGLEQAPLSDRRVINEKSKSIWSLVKEIKGDVPELPYPSPFLRLIRRASDLDNFITPEYQKKVLSQLSSL